PASKIAALRLGKASRANSDNTIHCQARSCGRFAPSIATNGVSIVMAARYCKWTATADGASPFSHAAMISAPTSAASEKQLQTQGAASVLPRNRRPARTKTAPPAQPSATAASARTSPLVADGTIANNHTLDQWACKT